MRDRPRAHTLIGLPYVYSNGREVPSGDGVLPSRAPNGVGPEPQFLYYVFFRVFRDERKTISKPPLVSFDLRREAEDVCFEIVGGMPRAFGYSSSKYSEA